ncbi:SPL family radical SAM protein [Alicyclobacillus dauci]|uniref:Radical SAM protein n=1 Tax=Alicyclobacillus dauci TaxID=1475485 RepID=A0ABY6Z6A7_9BACL|nr:radical SAM protein [Alicyclobacillus dauci]WAH37721.1 radical SAM protein [Alicyclobacillus dauci]
MGEVMRKAPTFENISSKQIMNKVTAPKMPFQWSINPYRGCTHGCSFCYARSTHSYLGLSPDDSFRQHVFVKDDAADVLEAQLTRKLRRHGGSYLKMAQDIGLVNIGTATDPYQRIEARRTVTRRCLEVLAHFDVPTSITTRSPLILRDLDILQTMNIQSINISVNTLDKSIWRNLEPATPAPIKRLETIRTLAQAGLPVGILMAPIIPFLTDSRAQLNDVLAAAVEHRAAFVIPSVLRLNPEVKIWFMQTIRENYPRLTAKYARLYRTTYAPSSYVNPLMDKVRKLMEKFGLHTQNTTIRLPRFTSNDGTTTDGSDNMPISEQSGVQMVLPI